MNKVFKILLIPVICFFIFNLYIFVSSRKTTQYATYGKKEDYVTAKGYIIKDETLLQPESGLRFYFSDGEKVARGVRLASHISESTDESVLSELISVEERIRLLRDSGADNAGTDPALINQQVKEKTKELSGYAEKKDFTKISEIKNEILLLRSKIESIKNGEDKNLLDALYDEKAQLESKIGSEGASVYAPVSGVLYLSADGFENVLYPEMADEITVGSFGEIESKRETFSQNAYKISDNFVYYIAAVIDAEDAKDFEEMKTAGINAGLRFSGFSSEKVSGRIEHISEEENGQRVIVLSCNKIANEMLSAREISVDIIKSSYEGFLLPAEAVRTEDGVEGVYVENGVNSYFKKVKVIYEDEETVIISSRSSEENELLLYDNVVIMR